MPRWPGTVLDRFVEKIDFEGPGGCWLFTGCRDSSGYGTAWDGNSLVGAHRLGWFLTVGPIPPGLTIDHLCRVPACVNPDHLEPCTQRVNNLRGTGASARNALKTHCPQGHEYTADNVYFTTTGGRRCKTCVSIWGRAARQQKDGTVCELPDCPRKQFAKGICQIHYNRQLRGVE